MTTGVLGGVTGLNTFLGHAESLAGWAWRANWQAAVMAVALAVMLWLAGKRVAPAWRFWLWALVLVRLAMPAIVEIGSARIENREVGIANSEAQTPSYATVPSGVELTELPREVHVAQPQLISKQSTANPAVTSPRYFGSVLAAWPHVRPFLLAGWLLGILLLATRITLSTLRLARAVSKMTAITNPRVLETLRECCHELRISRMPRALELPGNGAPALLGFLRPGILLPSHVLETMAADELRLILLHELAHLKRRDVLINWIATLIAVVHWPNPAVWLVGWRMRVERELACDELVLRLGRDAGGNTYARTIVKLVEALSGADWRGPAAVAGGAVGILEGKAQIQRRLVMIAKFDAKSRRWPVVAAGFGLLVGALALSGVTRAADKDGEKPGNAPPVAGSSDQAKPHDPEAEHKAAKKAALFLNSSLAGSPRNTAEDEKANARTAEKLRKPVPQVNFNGQGFADVIDFFRDASGVDFVVEWDALANAGVTRDTPITIRLHEATSLDAVLSLMFRSMGGQLQHEVDRGVVVISPSQRIGTSVMKVYDVSGLVATRTTGPVQPHAEAAEGGGAPGLNGSGAGGPPVSNPEVQQLISLITSTIQREIWTDNGGAGASIGVFKTKLVVKAPESVHKEILALLEDLQEKPPGKGK